MTARQRLLWVALVTGPAAWFASLVISYAATPPAHRQEHAGRLLAIHAGMLALAIASGLVGAVILRQMGRYHPDEGREAALYRFVALAVIVGAIIAALLIAAGMAPILLLGPGREP